MSRVLSDLVGKCSYKINYGAWKRLTEKIDVKPGDEIVIRVDCDHKNKRFDQLIDEWICNNCKSIIK